MKYTFLIIALLAGYATTRGQTLGSKQPYDPPTSAPVEPPPGYTIFYIDHVGRHGARHGTGTKELSALLAMLDNDSLTAQGRSLRGSVAALLAEEKMHTPGSLSQTGLDEQYDLGRRMALRLPLDKGACVTVTTTPEQRTQQSAESFLKGLGAGDSLPCLVRKGVDTIHLRFFSLAPAYVAFAKKGPWRSSLQPLEDALRPMEDSVARRVFAGGGKPGLCGALYAAVSLLPGLAHETGGIDLSRAFTPSEMLRLGVLDGAKDFLVKGPSADTNGIQLRVAAPLLLDFIQTASQRLAEGRGGADLRFAHAETIAPIAGLMGIEGAATPTADLAHYTRVWRADRVMVYSGNIQWVFYRRKGSPDLVEILFHERPVHIPVATVSFPFYKWSDVSAYYLARLASLGVTPETDLLSWLRNLR